MWRDESVLNASQGSQELHIEASWLHLHCYVKLLGYEASAPSGEPPAFKARTCVSLVHHSIPDVEQSVEDLLVKTCCSL